MKIDDLFMENSASTEIADACNYFRSKFEDIVQAELMKNRESWLFSAIDGKW